VVQRITDCGKISPATHWSGLDDRWAESGISFFDSARPEFEGDVRYSVELHKQE